MQWLEFPDGSMCELTGCSISVRRDVMGILGVVDCPSDFQIHLAGGLRVVGSGEGYIALVKESDAEELMLNSNLGLVLIEAISKYIGNPVIAAHELAFTAYQIAERRKIYNSDLMQRQV